MRYLSPILITLLLFTASSLSYGQCDGPVPMLCDADGDRDVDLHDIRAIALAKGSLVSGPGDIRDIDGDGMITVLDARQCVNLCDSVQCGVPDTPNRPPVADAGLDQSLLVGDTAILDGSDSSDIDGNVLQFFWSLVSRPTGSNAMLAEPGSVQPSFLIDTAGTYEAQLIVNDGLLNSVPDTVLVTTENSPPVADAGPDQNVFVTEVVQLDGSGSTDVDGDLLSFLWSLTTRPATSAVVLSDETALRPEFTADKPGTYEARLIVNDGQVDSSPDNVIVTTVNSAPVASAGPDQSGFVGGTINLDGSASSDVDGDPLLYFWSLSSRPVDSSSSITNPDSAQASFVIDVFGSYVVQLIVNDGKTDSDPDTAAMMTENSRPVADAGPGQSAFVGDLVVLNGAGSDDVDGDSLTYEWAFTNRPEGSGAELFDTTAINPTFTIDIPGDYVVQLIVNDGVLDSVPSTVMVTTENSRPEACIEPTEPVDVGGTANFVSCSNDADGNTLSFLWSLLSAPEGSSAVITDSDLENATLVPDVAGAYVVQLIVSDSLLDSDPVTATLTANEISSLDSDDDGLTDAEEEVLGTNPDNPDTDGDSLKDGDEVNVHGTNPLLGDSDGDTFGDEEEVAANTDPTNNTETPAGDIPPEPAMVAPPLDPTVPTTMAQASEFLYTGPNPIQVGMVPQTIVPARVAVLRGRVLQGSGGTLPGVTISILDQSAYGQTLSRLDGGFDLAVNGGTVVKLKYERPGYLTVIRQANVAIRDYTTLPDVVLTEVDSVVTTVDLTSGDPIQMARGSVVADSDGSRQATILVPQGTQAELVLPDGSTQNISTLNLRATEYTVGNAGPEAMPAQLPPMSGYTYAVELSADEAFAVGATDVRFNQPLPFYVEDFLGIPVGMAVPSGYYDRQSGLWIAAPDGRVIRILTVTAGLAVLDTNGDDSADDPAELAALGITDAERAQLAQLYAADQVLWRVPVDHFTPWDFNYPYEPPADAEEPNRGGPRSEADDRQEDNCDESGSIIECQNQILGERISLVGTGLSLNYRSGRVSGDAASYQLEISLSGPDVPASLQRIDLEVSVSGRKFLESFLPLPNQTYTFEWDGKDAYGRIPQAPQPVEVRLGYVYPAIYQQPAEAGQSFGSPSGTPIPGAEAREEAIIWETSRTALGNWDARAWGLGGWSLDVLHAYSPFAQTLYKGAGTRRGARAHNQIIDSVEDFTGVSVGDVIDRDALGASLAAPPSELMGPDGSVYIPDEEDHIVYRVWPDGAVTAAAGTIGVPGFGMTQLDAPTDVVVGSDGSVYVADSGNNRIQKIAPDGVISTYAGTGADGDSGDDGPATEAEFTGPYSLFMASDGSLYFPDETAHRVRRVGTDGIISTVAGDGTPGATGDGGPANVARLNTPLDVVVGITGNVYVADTANHRIRMIGTDGIISTVAGTGTPGYSGDGGPAIDAQLAAPQGIYVGRDESIYIADSFNHRVREVTSDGVIYTLAGDGTAGDLGDSGPATFAQLESPTDISLGVDGRLYILDFFGDRLRRIESAYPNFASNELLLPAVNGGEIYVFDLDGRHVETMHALTGGRLKAFRYDSSGLVTEIEDGNGNITIVERDAGTGAPTAIVSPYGYRTALTLDANGYLEQVSNPASESWEFTYTETGLLSSITDPNQNISTYLYDDAGRLERVDDPAGGFQILERKEIENGYEVRRTTAQGTVTRYRVEKSPTGHTVLETTFPDGTKGSLHIDVNGARTVTSANGTVSALRLGPDPRFGMLAPIKTSLATSTPSGLSYSMTAARSVVLRETDDLLNLESLTDTIAINGRGYSSIYDAGLNQTIVTSPESRQFATTLDAQGRVSMRQFVGLVPVILTYDSRGRQDSVLFGFNDGDSNARLSTLSYYDNTNAGTGELSGFLRSFINPIDQENRTTYFPSGAIRSQTLVNGQAISYGYDSRRNMTALTPPGRPAHHFDYTEANVLAQYTPPDIQDGEVEHCIGDVACSAFSYDQDSRFLTLNRSDGRTIEFRYDPTSEKLVQILIPRGAYDFTYDATTGELDTITSPDGEGLDIDHDGFLITGRTWSGTVNGSVATTHDANFQISRHNVNGNVIPYAYDDDGWLVGVGALTIARDADLGIPTSTMLGAVTTRRTYNEFGELAEYSAEANGNVLYSYRVHGAARPRDKLGRVRYKNETINDETREYEYLYDLSGQLLEVLVNDITIATYEYDANGNRTNVDGRLVAQYDDQDRLLNYDATSYSYTAHGELESSTEQGETTEYTYDVLGSLVQVQLPSGEIIDYVIDGQHRRIGKRINGTLVEGFLYKDQLNPIATVDASGNVLAIFAYGTHTNVPDYMVKSGKTYQLIFDHLGSVRLVVDVTTGAIVQQIDYDEFGNVRLDTNPGFQPFGFAGGIYDRDTNLTRFGYRDYDPLVGRWTAKDPILFLGGDSNLYRYMGGDPVNRGDATGLNPFDCFYVPSDGWYCPVGDDLKGPLETANPRNKVIGEKEWPAWVNTVSDFLDFMGEVLGRSGHRNHCSEYLCDSGGNPVGAGIPDYVPIPVNPAGYREPAQWPIPMPEDFVLPPEGCSN